VAAPTTPAAKEPFCKGERALLYTKSPMIQTEETYHRGKKNPIQQKEPYYIKAEETHHKVKKRNPAKRNQTLNTLS
jgi:hypothetical protein